jgi:hypothetical protein
MAKHTRSGDKDQARGGKRAAQGTGAAVADLPNAPVEDGPRGDDIARRAYELYLERGGQGDGLDLQDWLRAEAELTGRPRQS